VNELTFAVWSCVELKMLLWGAVGEVGYRSSQVVSGWARSAPRTSQNGSQVNVSLRPGALRTAQVIFQPDFQVLVQNITGCLIPIQTKLISELQYVLQTVSVAPPRYFCTIDAGWASSAPRLNVRSPPRTTQVGSGQSAAWAPSFWQILTDFLNITLP
jgi:hypothetical protein